MNSFEEIQHYLRGLRRRLNGVARTETLLSLWIAALGTVMVTLILAWLLGIGPGRWAWCASGIGLAVMAWLIWRLWWRPVQGRRSDEQLARWLEARRNGLEAGLITSIQVEKLLSQGRVSQHELGFSPVLAADSAHKTTAALRRLDPESLTNSRRHGKLSLAAMTLSMFAGFLAWATPSVIVDGSRALIEAPVSTSDERNKTIVVETAVEDLSLQLTFPAYVALKTRTVNGGEGNIQALAGTEVQFTGTTLPDTTSVVLLLESTPDARWPVTLSDAGVVRGSFRIGRSDRYRFTTARPGGVTVHESVWRNVSAIADQEPTVRLILPESDLEVHAGDAIAMLFEASDDFGVDHVDLVIAPSNSSDHVRRTIHQAHGTKHARSTYELMVGELKLQAGEWADIWFEASDRNTIMGPGIGSSLKRRITMYSPEEEHEELLTSLDELVDLMIDLLADRLESPIEAKDPQQLTSYVQKQTQISTRADAIIRALETLVSASTTDPLATNQMRSELRRSFEKLRGAHEQELAHLEKATRRDVITPRNSVLVALLFEVNQDSINALEQAIFTLKDVVETQRQDKLLDQARDMLDLQDELSDLLQRLKDGGSEELLAEAQRKLDQLQKSLDEMNRSMDKLAEKVPYENQNIADEPTGMQHDMRDLKSQLEEAKRLLAEGRIEEAMKLMEELNKATQEMVATLQDGMNRAPSTAAPMDRESQQAAQELQADLGELADEQMGLGKETEELERALREQREAALKQALEDARQQAQEIQKELNQISDQALHPEDQRSLEGLKEGAQQLETRLSEGDLGASIAKTDELNDGSQALEKELGKTEERESDLKRTETLREGMQRLSDVSERAKSLSDELKKLEAQQAQSPGKTPRSQGAQSERLGKQQGQLHKKLGQMRKKLESLDKKLPGAKDALGESLKQAGQAMKKAQGELGKQAPGKARPQQDQALEKLSETMNELQSRLKQAESNENDNGVGVNDPHRKVAIPEEDSYGVPRAFRAEILKVMKERAPERFDKAIERYYQELVK